MKYLQIVENKLEKANFISFTFLHSFLQHVV